MAEFWALTPRELAATFEAALWRQEQERRRDTVLAWQMAALSRAKRLPSLKSLLAPAKSKALTDAEQAKHREEFAEMSKRMGGKRD